MPKSLIVLGGGYIACELGQFLARIGARTTIIIRSGTCSRRGRRRRRSADRYFREEGIEVDTRRRCWKHNAAGRRKVVHYVHDGGEREVVGGRDLLRAGPRAGRRRPGPRAAACATTRSPGSSSTRRCAPQPHIFAVGDVTGGIRSSTSRSTRASSRRATPCRRERAGRLPLRRGAHDLLPIRKSRSSARPRKSCSAAGIRLRRRPVRSTITARRCLDKTKGFVKMMADRDDGTILGAAILGPHGSDLIHEVIVAMTINATVVDFMKIPHLHPTMAEIWTYPAEECAANWVEAPGDEQVDLRRASAVSEPRDRLRVAIVQVKPRKGRRREPRDAGRGVRAACQRPARPDRLARGRADRLLSRGRGLRSRAAGGTTSRPTRDGVARRGGRQSVDIVCGFYENDGGTYYNSALYLRRRAAARSHRARASQDVLADLRRVRRGALSLARAQARAFSRRGSARWRC